MEPSNISKEIKRLVDAIRHYDTCYFQQGISKISDYAYDQLVEQLTQLEQAYPHLKLPNSPTDLVGENLSKGFSVVYHQMPMLSLAKTYCEEEVAHFISKVKKTVSASTISFICEPKIDGVALSILYENGHLVRVVTRGDGEKGDDITRNASHCLPLPKKIQNPPCPSFEVRGEAFMTNSVFQALNRMRKAQGAPLWANPRNITTGTLKTLDVALVKERQLAFYGYSFYASSYSCPTQEAVLSLLADLGFQAPPTHKVCYSLREIMEYIHYWGENKKDLPVEVDGIVIKVNSLHQQHILGSTSKSPRWAIAYKYQPTVAYSTLERVTFQVGRTGAVTPVAHFRSIPLAGTMVRRASLHNADEIARQNLHLGDTIFIEKGGEIIPQVVGVDISRRDKTSQPIAFVQFCPACGTPLHREEGTVIYYCLNNQNCLPQLKGGLLHFAHRKAMDIDALGPKTVDALFEAKLVQTAADLYTLSYEDVSYLEGFQALSTQKLLANIQASKAKPFHNVLFALGIKHVGETIAKKLALHFRSMERLQQATQAELLQLPDIGEKIAESILDYLQDPYQQGILSRLETAGLQFTLAEREDGLLPLFAKHFVISGTFQTCTREELIKLIEAKGGMVLSSMSAKVHYLVAGNKAGPSKLAKAMEWSIPILAESDIIKMLQ